MPKWVTDNLVSPSPVDELQASATRKKLQSNTHLSTVTEKGKGSASDLQGKATRSSTKSQESKKVQPAQPAASEKGRERRDRKEEAKQTSKSSKSAPRRAITSIPPPPAPTASTAHESTTSQKNAARAYTSASASRKNQINFTSSTKPIETRPFKRKFREPSPLPEGGEEGEYDAFGVWRAFHPEKNRSGTEDSLHNVLPPPANAGKAVPRDQITPQLQARSGTGASPTPPLTDLRTPALALYQSSYTPTRMASGAPYHSVIETEQTKVPRNSLISDALLGSPGQLRSEGGQATQREPLFLSKSPTFSPSPAPCSTHHFGDQKLGKDQSLLDSQSQQEEAEDESLVQRPTTRRSLTHQIEEPYEVASDDEENSFGLIPTSSFLTRPDPFPHLPIINERSAAPESYRLGLIPGKKGHQPQNHVIIPSSDPEELASPWPAAYIASREKRKSRSSSGRKRKTYGRGRTHVYQHGIPLRHPPSQSAPLSPPRASPSYRGTKRHGSTSIWPDSAAENFVADSMDDERQEGRSRRKRHHSPIDDLASVTVDDLFRKDAPDTPVRKKRRRFVRNGPPPEVRVGGHLAGRGRDSDEEERERRRRRMERPRYPFTKVFKLSKADDEDNDVEYQRTGKTERRRRRRKRREIAKKHKRDRNPPPALRMKRNQSVQVRLDQYVSTVHETLKTPRRTGTRAHRKLKPIPGYTLKKLPAIPYEEYAKAWQEQGQSKSEYSRSEPSGHRIAKGITGGRVDELISLARKARFEHAIRRQRPFTRGSSPGVRLKCFFPSQDDILSDEDIEVDPTQPHPGKRGVLAGRTPNLNRIPKLAFNKAGHTKHPHSTGEPTTDRSLQSSLQGRNPANTLVLGHELGPPQLSRPVKRRPIPMAPRHQSFVEVQNTSDLSEAEVILSSSPPDGSKSQQPSPARNAPPAGQPTSVQLEGGCEEQPQMADHQYSSQYTQSGRELDAQGPSSVPQTSRPPKVTGVPLAPAPSDDRPSEILRTLSILAVQPLSSPAPQDPRRSKSTGTRTKTATLSEAIQPVSPAQDLTQKSVEQPGQSSPQNLCQPASSALPALEDGLTSHPPAQPPTATPPIIQNRSVTNDTSHGTVQAADVSADAPAASQFDLDQIFHRMDAAQIDDVNMVLSQVEAERVSKRSSKSRSASQHTRPALSSGPGQAVNPRDGIKQVSSPKSASHHLSDKPHPRDHTDVNADIKEAPQSPIVRTTPETATLNSTRRMTGMEVTQHLMNRPLLPEVAESINRTMLDDSARIGTEPKIKSRKGRIEERAKRVIQKRSRESREKQTKLDFSRSTHSIRVQPTQQGAVCNRETDLAIDGGDEQNLNASPQIHSGPSRLQFQETEFFKNGSSDRGQVAPAESSRQLVSQKSNHLSKRPTRQLSARDLQQQNEEDSRAAFTAPFKPPSHDPSQPYTYVPQAKAVSEGPALSPTQVSTQPPPAAQRTPPSYGDGDQWNRTPNIQAWRSGASRADHPPSTFLNKRSRSDISDSDDEGDYEKARMTKTPQSKSSFKSRAGTSFASKASMRRNQGGNALEREMREASDDIDSRGPSRHTSRASRVGRHPESDSEGNVPRDRREGRTSRSEREGVRETSRTSRRDGRRDKWKGKRRMSAADYQMSD